MTRKLSANTQAILLLTAPLIAGRGSSSVDQLSPSEYKRLARHLREIKQQPADLVSPDSAEVLAACNPVIDEDRLRRLLDRGFLLSQVIERWQARAIWVISRADAEYPRRLKVRLREDAPAVLYGCGEIDLLERGGLAVVGSRNVDDTLVEYTVSVGQLAARSGKVIVSGGAKGIDQAAMRGALDAGGRVCGVLADSLEKTSMNREHRNLLLDGRLMLVSPYDPNAGFNVGNAMQRNKLIYALADASLVVSSDVNKGGTWAGAVEQLDKLKLVPVYVRSKGEGSAGLDALRSRGAIPWPNPEDADSFAQVFAAPATLEEKRQPDLELFNSSVPSDLSSTPEHSSEIQASADSPTALELPSTEAPNDLAEATPTEQPLNAPQSADHSERVTSSTETASDPAVALFVAVKTAILTVLQRAPMKDTEIALALDISSTQLKVWLHRLITAGDIEKQKKSAIYTIKQTSIFG